jgi:hypothetical protein
MHESQAKLNYSFGEITVKVAVDGNIDRPNLVIDHMLSTLTTVTGIEVVQYGVTDSQRDEGALRQKCVASVQFGEITVNAEIDFNLKRHISKRTLNSIVFSSILPKIWQTAGIYLGDNKLLTSPPAPLPQKSHREVMDSIDGALLGATSFGSETDSSQLSEQHRQRQLATR